LIKKTYQLPKDPKKNISISFVIDVKGPFKLSHKVKDVYVLYRFKYGIHCKKWQTERMKQRLKP